MIDPFLQMMLDSPIDTAARANKTFLPAGKRDVIKSETAELARLAKGRAQRAAKKAEDLQRREQLLDYYSSTEIPFERIAECLNMKPDAVETEMAARGRTRG